MSSEGVIDGFGIIQAAGFDGWEDLCLMTYVQSMNIVINNKMLFHWVIWLIAGVVTKKNINTIGKILAKFFLLGFYLDYNQNGLITKEILRPIKEW